jgi:hypothetical protein
MGLRSDCSRRSCPEHVTDEGIELMTQPLDPDIKALRAINRALAELPDDSAVQRVIEWTVARAAGKKWITLPRLKWIFGQEGPER